ncbi:hypothetical protein [Flavobacterium sp. MK4S-17]|uniref:hypothetical protein n=1 Tax=Flavobacterium sp. MK4S-17 TaxID=2543737 RepID=UPI00135867FB|nr:hypothetical protein [Flavobacterium sp. MK4S-17]
MKNIKTLIKIVLGLGILLYLIFIIFGFFHSWKSSLIWIIGAIFLLTLWGSFFENKDPQQNKPKFSNGLRIFLLILSLVAYGWGAYLLPDEVKKSSSDEVVNPVIKKDRLVKKIVQKPNIDLESLKLFQKQWADSVVKSYEGQYIISCNFSLPDTISFELSKGATQNFNSNERDNLPMLKKNYYKALKSKLGSQYDTYTTIINYIPNKVLAAKSNPSDWTHPIFKNTGIKIYSGDEYTKEYVGTLRCEFKDETDGYTYYVVYRDNGEDINIVEYDFRNYWVKKADADERMGIGLKKCF